VLRRRAVVEGEVECDGHHQPADRAGDREDRGLQRGERSLDELALHFRPDDQEEQWHQRIVDPFGGGPAERPCAIAETDRPVPQAHIIGADGRIDDDQRQDRRDQQRPTRNLADRKKRLDFL
jgi:hypothetical protein